jgi:hypothetical protein
MIFKELPEKAPDEGIIFSDGSKHMLSDIWKKNPIFLVFLRHFG